MPTESLWMRSYRADVTARVLADRHYSRRRVGAAQFVPPGRCVVLLALGGRALWVTSWQEARFVRHAWPGAWVNSCFRRESGPRASDLIRSAIAATCAIWPQVPREGMITFVDRECVRAKRDPGWCYLRAGFRPAGTTRRGLLALHLAPADMPEPCLPAEREPLLF